MKTTEEIIVKQLDSLYARDQKMFEQRTNIRNWFITIWLAAFAIISSQLINIGVWAGIVLLVTPVFIFWFFEAIYTAITRITVDHACELEMRLAENDYSFKRTSDIFMLSHYSKISQEYKAKEAVKCIFKYDVMFLYIAFLVASILAIYLLK